MYTYLIDAAELVVLAGIVNISLNLLGAIKRTYDLDRFDPPFDLGFHIGRERVLGVSTTWWGLVVALGVGTIISIFYPAIGLTLSLGTYFGHALGSFIKRRLHYPDGVYMPVVDHGDYIFLAGFLLLLQGAISGLAYGAALVIVLTVHPFFCLLGYKMGIRKRIL